LDQKLFRLEALNARQIKWQGDILLIRPVSFSFLTSFAVIIAGLIISILLWGSYTKRSTIAGQLVPESGVVKVYVPQPGIVLEKLVSEGQIVKRGEVLFVLSSERQSSTQGEIQAAISRQVLERRQSLSAELGKTYLLQQEERRTLLKKIAGFQAELLKLGGQIENQKNRVKISEESVSRYQALLSQDYISKEQVQQKQGELLDQYARLQNLERDLLSIQRELVISQNELESLIFKHQNQHSQIKRNIIGLGQELTESEAKRRLFITAPETGMATAVLVETGQAVDPSKPLVSIVPAGSKLQVHLYAQSRAVGFIKPGDEVLVRYQAFPYQKFGHHKGVVNAISKTALPGSELIGSPCLSGGNNELLYRITVDITSQEVRAYGRPQPLQAGMLLEADVLQDTRRLYEWVLEPLYSLSGKL
jgi:membrane fusion protein